MSDKMLMENWREFLAEEDQFDTPATIDWETRAPDSVDRRGEPMRPSKRFGGEPLEGRGTLEKAIGVMKTYSEKLETRSDFLIEQLPQKSPFWKEIFTVDDWDRIENMKDREETISGRIKNNPYAFDAKAGELAKHKAKKPTKDVKQIVDEYHAAGELDGPIQKWRDVTTFVLICRQTNIDEKTVERVQKVTDAFGEGANPFSKVMKWGAALVAGIVGAIASAPKWIGAALTLVTVGGPVSTHINNKVREKDMIKLSYILADELDVERNLFSRELTGEFGEKPIFEKALAQSLEKDFHEAEFQVMDQLTKRPGILPIVRLMVGPRQKMKDFDVVDSLRARESKFHDNWRNFLLTEEKK